VEDSLYDRLLVREGIGDEPEEEGDELFPCWWENTNGLVVARETVDTGLDKNEAELGVLVLAVALEVLADRDGLVHATWVSIAHPSSPPRSF
jgi:hypothetical protein